MHGQFELLLTTNRHVARRTHTSAWQMQKSAFQLRKLKVAIDMMETAEFDALSYQVPPSVVEKIAINLKNAPYSTRDRAIKSYTVRELYTYDVLFMRTRLEKLVAITIVHIQPNRPEPRIKVLLRWLGLIAKIRSVTGL